MISQRDGVIAELRDEACTLWASGWLAFQCRVAKAFLSLNFNLQVPDEEEAEESIYEDEADPEVLSDTPNSVPFPGEAEILTEAGFSPSPAGASSSDSHGLEAHTTEAARSSTPNIYAPLYNLCSFWLTSSSKPRTSITLTSVLLFY